MFPLVSVALTAAALTGPGISTGVRLHVRLEQSIGSFASRANTPVRATLIAPVKADGAELPAGSILSGKIASVRKVGFGIVHETAAIDLKFTSITFPGGAPVPLSARVAEVDNGRERVTAGGRIEGVRATSSISYRASGYIRTLLLWNVHAELAEWFIKTLIVQLPEPEIYYPAGSELTLQLTAPLRTMPAPVETPAEDPWPRGLSGGERESLAPLVADLPDQTSAPGSSRGGDVVNVLFLGSRQQIQDAFENAGWSEALPSTLKSGIKGIRAVAEDHGYRDGPMSALLVNGEEPEMTWQKGLNDFAKRHHIRIWKQPGTWNGREVWIGAATRDVDLAYMRPGRMFTHKVGANVDLERDKIGDDLAFASCLDALDWQDRPEVAHEVRNATGDWMDTDGRVAILEMKDCGPAAPGPALAANTLRPHGGRWQRFARKEVMSARSDLIRDNIYWRSYEGARWTFAAIRHERHHPPAQDPAGVVSVVRRRDSGDLDVISLR